MHLAIGFVTNFFDTLGIGSFAPTTAAFKFRGVVADETMAEGIGAAGEELEEART